MLIRYGFDIELEFSQRTTLIAAMDVHPSRRRDIVEESGLIASRAVPVETFTDPFGNMNRRLTAQAGPLTLKLEGIVRDTGSPDEVDWAADASLPSDLPQEAMFFLPGSRYCETDLLSDFAWSRFGQIEGGWAKVEAICEFANKHLAFSYANAKPTRTAAQAMDERTGVCRDFTHLAITLCRCLNIPARYCNGYLGDIGVPPDPAPMDFNAWFEVYLGRRWRTFDARHRERRIGRILIARGRDAADVAMITSFGPHRLGRFTVVTEQITGEDEVLAA
jgi:transglutaminase-like putative cysteine protease